MHKIFISLLSLCLLAGCQSATTITPEKTGPLHVGMSTKEVMATRLGFVLEEELTPGCREGLSSDGKLGVLLENEKLMVISAMSQEYATPEGIHVGSTEHAAQQAYGTALAKTPHTYDPDGNYLSVIRDGKGYHFETDGKIIIRIHAGQMPALQYVEGCL